MSTDSAAELAQNVEQQRRVRALVDELPVDLRVPLLLRFEDDLTFSAIGSALHVSESTAHERVQRALERLRTRVGCAGLGIAATALPAELPRLLASAPLESVPSGLQVRLLQLWQATVVSSAAFAKLAAFALLLTGLSVAAVSLGTSGGAAPPVPNDAVHAAARGDGDDPPRDASSARGPVSGEVAEPPQDPVAEHVNYRGSVLDAVHAPVDGAHVIAVAAGGFKPFEIAEATTNAAGKFELRVSRSARPVPARKIRVRVMDGSLRVYQSDELQLPVDDDSVDLLIVLAREAGLQGSRYSLAVIVRGEGGAPVTGARVMLYPVASLLPAGQLGPWIGTAPGDCEGRTDARGVAQLRGRVPGKKVVFVDGRPLGLRTGLQAVEVRSGGEHRCAVDLDAGEQLHVQISSVDGGVPKWANVWLLDETARVNHTAKMDGDGVVRFAHLGVGPFTLRVTANPWSPAQLTGLRPRDKHFEVRLKQQSDERDVGNHQAELHGRLFDAATREVVAFREIHVEVRDARPGGSTLTLDRAVQPRPVQRMLDNRKYERFHLTGLEAGEHAIVVDIPGYCRTVVVASLTENQLRAGMEIDLYRGVTVAGRVVGGDGAAVARAVVFVAGFGAGADAHVARVRDAAARGKAPRSAYMLPCSARTDENGSFKLERVPPLQHLRLVALTESAAAESGGTAFQPGEQRGGFELRVQ